MSRPTRSVCALLAFATLALTASSAAAQHRPHNNRKHTPPVQQQTNLIIKFDELQATVEGNGIRIRYQIAANDWRMLSQHRIEPRLNLYTPTRRGDFEFTYSSDLKSRSGEVWFSNVQLRGNRVEIRLSGDRGRVKIASTSYRNVRANRVSVTVTTPPPPRRGHDQRPAKRWTQAQLVDACSAATSWSSDLGKCIEKGKLLDDAPNTVAACSAATSWASDMMKCLDLAANLRASRADQIIGACSANTQWGSDFTVCLTEAPRLGHDAARTINACGAASTWASDFKQCLVASRR